MINTFMLIATIILYDGFVGAQTMATGFKSYNQCLSARQPVFKAIVEETKQEGRPQHAFIMFSCVKEFDPKKDPDWKDQANL
jgi:hypothetical protein